MDTGAIFFNKLLARKQRLYLQLRDDWIKFFRESGSFVFLYKSIGYVGEKGVGATENPLVKGQLEQGMERDLKPTERTGLV